LEKPRKLHILHVVIDVLKHRLLVVVGLVSVAACCEVGCWWLACCDF
jgi:hypothetical protein